MSFELEQTRWGFQFNIQTHDGTRIKLRLDEQEVINLLNIQVVDKRKERE